jgi:hypothetical protein
VGTTELASAVGATEWKKSFLGASLAFHVNLAPFTPKLCMVVYIFPLKKQKTTLNKNMRNALK